MVSKNVTNHSASPLGLPRGGIVNPGATIRVDDWEKKEGNSVVKAWVEAGMLTVANAPARDDAAATKRPVLFRFTDKDTLGKTKDELVIMLQSSGAEVDPRASKDDLLAQVRALPAA